MNPKYEPLFTPFKIGGVEIPYELGLVGHSDADVLIHALMDAMLGACALGDIGAGFLNLVHGHAACQVVVDQ